MKTHQKLAILTALAGLSISPAIAQDLRSASQEVVACQSVEGTAERLACFEAAASQLSTVLAAPEPQIAEAPAAAPTPPAPIQQATVSAPQVPAQPAQSSVAAPQTPVAAATAAAPAADAAPVQQASTEVADSSDDLGRGSILPSWIPRVSFGRGDDVEKEPDEFATQLTRIQRNNLGRHFFTTAEGHVWRQIGIEKIKAPKSLPADVILKQNLLGGIEIEIVETNRSYSVARIE